MTTTLLPPWALYPPNASSAAAPALGDIVRAAAERWPDRPALEDGRQAFSFGALERGAQSVAGWLADRGVRGGDRVVVLTCKSALVPVVAFAAWKCGAVYVPCDGELPPARLRRLIERIRPRAVVALDGRDPITDDACWMDADGLAMILDGPGRAWTTRPHAPSDAAYIIFTSGSTGDPKGVEITVDSLRAYFTSHNEILRLGPRSRVLSLAPFHFDVSIEDTFLPLSVGACVYQFRGIQAGPIMRAVLARERITHLIAVSTLLTLMTGDGCDVTRERFPDLKLVMTGAELCDPRVIDAWKRGLPGVRVFNVYGPTEATIVCTAYEIAEPDPDRVAPYPIGRPLSGVDVRIVDADVEIREAGRAGELWVGGDQVMRGYLDDPEETNRLVTEVAGVRFYRTGDFCSYDERGDIVFEGRRDDEVKLAGRRVHLGEIRAITLGQPGVDRAAVTLVPRAGRDVIGLIVMSDDRLDVLDVEARLTELLPEYMRPAVLAWSPTVAVATTGKTDERRLGTLLLQTAGASAHRYYVFNDEGCEPWEP